MFLETEVTVIGVDDDGDGGIDREIILVESVEDEPE